MPMALWLITVHSKSDIGVYVNDKLQVAKMNEMCIQDLAKIFAYVVG